MPVKRCVKNGKKGWKWGDNGFCYTAFSDDVNKDLAEKQGRAVKASGYKEKK